jgi:hypothetical protein
MPDSILHRQATVADATQNLKEFGTVTHFLLAGKEWML